jgi:hypothetical protein
MESAVPDSPTSQWTPIDTAAFGSVDPDPTAPAPRSVTTMNAALTTGWYRLVFTDDAGHTSEPSQAVRSSTDSEMPPTPADIRNLSPLLRQNYPLPAVDPYAWSDLRSMVYTATMLVQSNTWRIIDPTLGCPAPVEEGYSCELLPPELVDVARQAILKMTERLSVTAQPAFASQIASGRRLRGFTAGPYSENYFDPGQFARKGTTGRPAMDNDDAIDAALWALATEDARDYFMWRATGAAPPTGVPSTFDYRRQSLGYGAGEIGIPGGFARGGPDGW